MKKKQYFLQFYSKDVQIDKKKYPTKSKYIQYIFFADLTQ